MPAVYSTIADTSHAHRCVENPKKAAPLTTEQQKEKAAARAEKQAHIDVYVQKWMEDMANLAATMATEFDMKPRYFLDIFFQGFAHMINHQDPINLYNAFKSFKAAEVCKGMYEIIHLFFISDMIHSVAGDSKSVVELY
jgi:hypothetical protein